MKRFITIAAISLVAVLSCSRNDDEHHFSNVAYFSVSSSVSEVRVAEEDDVISREVSIGMALPEDADVNISVNVDESLMERYRLLYADDTAQLLPSDSYTISAVGTTISSGSVESLPLKLTFSGANRLPDLKGHYVLPLTLSSEDVDVLESGSTLYYVLSKASLVNVAADLTENRAWPEWKDPEPFRDLPAFTMEALVNATAFKRNDGDGNKIASPLATVMGIEDRFLIRVGDTQIPDNQIQVAWAQQDGEGSTLRGSVSNSAMQIKAGKWYHIAVSFDAGEVAVYLNGNLVGTGSSASLGITTVDFSTEHSEEDDGKPRCFWVGYSYDSNRYWNGMLSEVRLWNRVLSADEILSENHFYRVDASSDGLIAYWKFDDGAGSTVKDYSPLGNDLTSQLPLTWYSVSLPEE